jgi:hypothetical protein
VHDNRYQINLLAASFCIGELWSCMKISTATPTLA